MSEDKKSGPPFARFADAVIDPTKLLEKWEVTENDWGLILRLQEVAEGLAERCENVARYLSDSDAEIELVKDPENRLEYTDGTFQYWIVLCQQMVDQIDQDLHTLVLPKLQSLWPVEGEDKHE